MEGHDLRRALAEAGLSISAGKMSHLWSSTPISVRLDDLDVICAVLDCTPAELLLAEAVSAPQPAPAERAAAQAGTIRPERRGRSRSAPPV